MKKSRFSSEQIIGFIKQADSGMEVGELCSQHGFSPASFYQWRALIGVKPELCKAILQLGWNEAQAASWSCHTVFDLSDVPARLVATGNADSVLAIVLRSLHGIY